MSELGVSQPDVRCVGCGLPNPTILGTCRACGTLLRAAGSASPAASAAPVTDLRERVLGAGRLFVAILGLWVAGTLAHFVGVPWLTVEIATTAVFAVFALACAISVRSQIIPLLARTGGWRAGVAALAGFGMLVAFGSLSFPAIRALGVQMESATDLFVAVGWPRWVPYLVVAVCPGLFEEVMFRGYVMSRLDLLLTPRETLVVQAVLFSLLHLGLMKG